MVPAPRQGEAPHRLTAPPAAAAPLPAAVAGFAAAMRLHQDITCRQVVLLACAAKDPGTSVGPLAVRMGVRKPLVTRNTHALADLGLLTVRRDEDDLRRVRIMPTPLGLQVLDIIAQARG
jgi:DNA-binding MarR family transcriptional regulator